MALYKILFDYVMVPMAPGYGIVDPAEVDPADREYVYYARYDKANYSNEELFASVELPESVAAPLVEMGALEETTEKEAKRDFVGVIDRTVAGAEGPNALTNTEQAASLDINGQSAKPHAKNVPFVAPSSPEEFDPANRENLSLSGDADGDGEDLPPAEQEPQAEPQKRASGQSGADQPRKKKAASSRSKSSNSNDQS